MKHSFITHFYLTPPQKCFQAISEKGKQQKEALQSSGHLPGRGWTLDGTRHKYSWKTEFN